ncbi:ABC-type dipeptide/oligopeptide/nickel transport system ATPase subunit [Rhizobium sp. BK529]|nr:ABC-type dipeptide/oligopeptide/nickel transport system ATPase subunit [Rhizobium sp. BK529]
MLVMKDGRFIDELSKSDLETGTTHETYSRELFEASFM